MTPPVKHPVEAKDSFASYLERMKLEEGESESSLGPKILLDGHRNLKKGNLDLEVLAEQRQDELIEKMEIERQNTILAAKKKHEKKKARLMSDSGIDKNTVHGMMIDAGSGGSRMHVFEWEPRVLGTIREVNEAVSGKKLTYPGGDSRWTDRLSPGIATFATNSDEKLLESISEYLKPLMDFAKTMLATKEDSFQEFPIYFRATAGMRVLEQSDRFRVMDAVRTLFSDKSFCPFQFVNEYARVISGEEEAIFGWTGINFAMGTLIPNSEGAGAVLEPRLTYGGLDMGGASTQISFYEPNGDIMANLFKLQIGQGKHWNLYAHSFLFYGIEEAKNRLEARLINDMNKTARLAQGVYNPCLPGGVSKLVRTSIFVNKDGFETWNSTGTDASKDGYREAILRNDRKRGDGDACLALAKDMLHKGQNEWCKFSHRGECSFAGIYQPQLPHQSKHFGEFLAFSNYYHVWDFLDLPVRSSLSDLKNATRYACSLSEEELHKFNDGRIDESQVNDFCFHSAFAYNVLHHGYGFTEHHHITATNVVNGQKVGWALGAMLYEINTLPWKVVNKHSQAEALRGSDWSVYFAFFVVTCIAMLGSIAFIFYRRRKSGLRAQYQPINGR